MATGVSKGSQPSERGKTAFVPCLIWSVGLQTGQGARFRRVGCVDATVVVGKLESHVKFPRLLHSLWAVMPGTASPSQPTSTNAASTSQEVALGFPPLTRSAVLSCSFSAWYPIFRRQSPKATVIKPLHPSFVDYLESDGLFVPQGSDAERCAPFHRCQTVKETLFTFHAHRKLQSPRGLRFGFRC
jgi:D123